MKKLFLQLCLLVLTLAGLSSCVGFEDYDSGPRYRSSGYTQHRTYYDDSNYGYGYRQYGSSNYCPPEQHHYSSPPKKVQKQDDDDRPLGRDGHHHCDCADDHHKNMSCGCRPHHPKGGCRCGR